MIKVKIPLIPASVNGLYKINYTHRVVYLSEEGRAFKYQAKLYFPPISFRDRVLLSISVEYHDDWFYKNGKVRRADSINLDKLMADTISEFIGVDDSRFWVWKSRKVQDSQRYTTVVIEEVGTDDDERAKKEVQP